jgi:hypothetical protein
MKKFAENFILKRGNNIFIGIVVWIIIFLLAKFLVYDGSFERNSSMGNIVYYLFLFGSGALVWSSKVTVPPRLKRHLIDVFGASTEIWLPEGWYLSFFLFKLDDQNETITKERDKIEVGPFPFTDKKGKKLIGFVTGIYEVGSTPAEMESFKLMKQDEIQRDLKTYLERSFLRKFQPKDFDEIRGNEKLILPHSELSAYGVNFVHVDPVVISGNMDQDDFNYQFGRLKIIKLNDFRNQTGRSSLTPDELRKIDDEILVELNRVKKIITDSPLLGRYDIT